MFLDPSFVLFQDDTTSFYSYLMKGDLQLEQE